MNVDKSEIVGVYTRYALVSTGFTTVTGLPSLSDEIVSPNGTTRIFKGKLFNSAYLWKASWPIAGRDETYDKCLSIYDSISERQYTDKNKLISGHWNHVKNRSVKGADFITTVYSHRGVNVPLTAGFVTESKKQVNPKTGNRKRISCQQFE